MSSLLADLLHGPRTAIRRHRARRAAERQILDLAVQLRDVIRNPRSSPQAQTNLLNEIANAVDRRERSDER